MTESVNLPLSAAAAEEYGGWSGLRAELARLGLQGVEGIWPGEPIPEDFPRELLTGYHLTFFADWLDFYRADSRALLEKFGSMDTVRSFYGGEPGPESLLKLYRDDLARARALGARYVVFHVSDVSVEETFTYRWLHGDDAVLDASAEIINLLTAELPQDDPMLFLVENQWWPGFTFREPQKTERLLDAIDWPGKGIMLDTGHLMNTDPSIRSQKEGLRLLERCIREHGALSRCVRGLHLHQSVSGAYVRRNCGALPPEFPAPYWDRFAMGYRHVQQLDRHRPWTEPGIAAWLDAVGPEFVTHELAVAGPAERRRAVQRQRNTIRKGRCELP